MSNMPPSKSFLSTASKLARTCSSPSLTVNKIPSSSTLCASTWLTNEPTGDTHLLQDYFTELRDLHHASTEPKRKFNLYVCPMVFDRNSHDSPAMVRLADNLWASSGLANLASWSRIKVPISVYSLPTAIGEDLHMLLKAFFKTGGRLVTVPIFSPGSQCNVSCADEHAGWSRTITILMARYYQGVRHMWGCLDTGYAIRELLATPVSSLTWDHLGIIEALWEFHIIPTHMAVLAVASGLYAYLTPAEQIAPMLQQVFWVTGLLGQASFLGMQISLTVFEWYHDTCIIARSKDLISASGGGVAARSDVTIRQPLQLKYLMERLLLPLVALCYGSIPAVFVQVSHFWTQELVYMVSAKPLPRKESSSGAKET
jgi:hypothetical protein